MCARIGPWERLCDRFDEYVQVVLPGTESGFEEPPSGHQGFDSRLHCADGHAQRGCHVRKRGKRHAFGCEVIMYQEVISVKCRVIYFVLTEGDVTNHCIEVAVRQYSFFITTNLNIGFRVQLLGNAASYGVNLHAKQMCAFVEAGRSVCEERTHTHTWLQNIAALQAKAPPAGA